MLGELERFLKFMKPAFSRAMTYQWFVMVFIGLLLRGDSLGGVSSIVRALMLDGIYYDHLRRFFYSSAWSVEGMIAVWWKWLVGRISFRVNGRMVFVADHTKVPKDGRKMPSVTTLHQDSETAAKPSYFRGHHWGCLSVVEMLKDKFERKEAIEAAHLRGHQRFLESLQRDARFVKISSAGLRESHAHDVIITKEAPNYRLD